MFISNFGGVTFNCCKRHLAALPAILLGIVGAPAMFRDRPLLRTRPYPSGSAWYYQRAELESQSVEASSVLHRFQDLFATSGTLLFLGGKCLVCSRVNHRCWKDKLPWTAGSSLPWTHGLWVLKPQNDRKEMGLWRHRWTKRRKVNFDTLPSNDMDVYIYID